MLPVSKNTILLEAALIGNGSKEAVADRLSLPEYEGCTLIDMNPGKSQSRDCRWGSLLTELIQGPVYYHRPFSGS